MGLSGVTSLINLPQYFGGTVKPISVYWSSTYITAIGDHCWNIDVSIGGVLNIPTFHIPLVTLPHSTWFKIPKFENYPWGVVNLLLFLQLQHISPTIFPQTCDVYMGVIFEMPVWLTLCTLVSSPFLFWMLSILDQSKICISMNLCLTH